MTNALNAIPAGSLFRSCSGCGQRWATLSDFLSDPDVVLAGYQANFTLLEAGFLLFNHITPACGTTMAPQVANFTSLVNGPIFKERLTGTSKCPNYCLNGDVFAVCPNKCECAYVREILDRVNRWPKKKAG